LGNTKTSIYALGKHKSNGETQKHQYTHWRNTKTSVQWGNTKTFKIGKHKNNSPDWETQKHQSPLGETQKHQSRLGNTKTSVLNGKYKNIIPQ
jgi:hypothetical protein